MRVQTTRPAVYRLMRIHEEIRSGRYPSAPRLASLIEVSPRTVQRDIEYMLGPLGMRIEYNPAKHGYHYLQDGVELPAPRLGEGELVAVLVGTKVLAQYAGTPFEANLRRAFARMEKILPEEVSLRVTDLADAADFSVTAPRAADIELFRRLIAAVRRRRRLSVVYESLSGGKTTSRVVDPYRMACVNAGGISSRTATAGMRSGFLCRTGCGRSRRPVIRSGRLRRHAWREEAAREAPLHRHGREVCARAEVAFDAEGEALRRCLRARDDGLGPRLGRSLGDVVRRRVRGSRAR